MAKGLIGVGDPKAVQKYSAFLAVDTAKKSYFNKKMMGHGEEAQTPLQTLSHLESDAGDKISYDLVMQLKMRPVQGDKILRGNEEDLKYATDSLLIDQLRGGVNTGGKMSRKRTIHDQRKISRVRQSEWWARLFDETFFIYLSGARGVNADFIEGTDFTGYAGNALSAPDTRHLMYGGNATSKASVDSADKMDLSLIDRAKTRANTLGGGTSGIPALQPIELDGEPHFVCVMHEFQEYDMRTATGTGGWLDIQKSLATYEGRNSPICKGGLGMHNNVILHSHKSPIVFSDYGAGGNVAAARALFMGRQAGVVAFGSPGTGLRFDWTEEMEDRGNQLVVTTSTIMGVKKATFTSPVDNVAYDFGVIALDTAAADPT